MRPLFLPLLLAALAAAAHAAELRVVHASYGRDAAQTMDVYIPPRADHAPAIFMVHGGGWKRGDKESATVVANKRKHWNAKGYVFISINYRLLPDAAPLAQAADVLAALEFVQRNAHGWGTTPEKIVLAGHSAGAHLVALLTARGFAVKLKPAGAILLDSAALDVPRIMEARHFGLYDDAFGSDPAVWRAASPFHAMTAATVPILAVCSTRRRDSCAQARAFVAKAESLGTRASVLEENRSHREINDELGLDSDYTRAVDRFIAGVVPR